MKNKKRLLFLLILVISIGFAYLSTNLNITGSSLIKGNTWDVHFENVQVTSGSVTATTPTISTDKKSVNYTVTLDMPGDYFEFTVDAVNAGTIDAMVDTVSNTGLTEDQLKYINYIVKLNNDEPLNNGSILLKQTRKTYKVRLEYKLDISEDDLPDSDQNLELTFTVNYKQIDNNKYTTATFIKGSEVAAKMRDIAGNEYDDPEFVESRMIKFLRSNELSSTVTEDDIISTEDSDVPIYIWAEESNEKIYEGSDINGYNVYWYSTADVVYLNENSSHFFSDITNDNYEFQYLRNIEGLENVDTSKVKSVNYMFWSCKYLNDYTAIKNWNTSNLENMQGLFFASGFKNCMYLKNWDTSKVESFRHLFQDCYELVDTYGLENINFSSAEDYATVYMFSGCTSLTDLTGISNWNFQNIRYMFYMFENCKNLTSLAPISNWNMSKIESINNMFLGCTNLSDATAIENWDVSSVTNMRDMFNDTATTSETRPSWYIY